MASSCVMESQNDSGDVEILVKRTALCDESEMDLILTSKQFNCYRKEEPVKKKKGGPIQCCIPWCDVIKSEMKTQKSVTSVVINYIEKQKNKQLRIKTLNLTFADGEEEKLVSTIQEQCSKSRPKKVFVVINPVGGNGKGETIYQKDVAPIFEMAGIEAKVIVSERAKHGLEIGESYDFTGYDGIITVGGDGIYQEVLQGYIKQLQRNAGIELSPNNADKLIKPQIPFCPLPAGSSNGLAAYTNNGTADCLTSVLRIIKGEVNQANALIVFDGHEFLGLCFLGVAVGIMTDFMKAADEKRWMKKHRYAYCMATTLLKKRRYFDAKVELLTAPADVSSQSDVKVQQQESACNKDVDKADWITYDSKGKLYTSLALFACDLDSDGSQVVVNLFKSTSMGIADTGCSNIEFFKVNRQWFGKRLTDPIPNYHPLKNLKGMRFNILRDEKETDSSVTGARAKNRELEQYVFLDGEILRSETLKMEARLLDGFLPMFSTLPE